ncbi:hypothetical protein OAM02_01520 [Verrucomicrobia bacterium]|nr:hypothetical protein [Verrucomicrobiota bacterium]
MDNISNENGDDLWLKAQEACAQSVEKTPKKSDWGMYSYSDAPAAVGGGFGAFQWFSNYEKLRDFLRTYFMYQTPSPWGDDFENKVNVFIDLIDKSSTGEDLNKCLTEINILIKHYYVIEWLGTFEGLCSSIDGFPTKIRNEYRSCLDDPKTGDSSPIKDDELEYFLKEFLSQYGL